MQVWWPIPRDPVWSITQTCPVSRPMAAAAAASRTWSTTWTSRKWLPPPRLPSCAGPRVAARSDTWAGSAPGTVPPSSQAAASSSTPIPWASGWRTLDQDPLHPGPVERQQPGPARPRGMRLARVWTSSPIRSRTSVSQSRSLRSRRTPQPMSKPTLPGETTPPAATSVAATPPIGKP